MKILGIIVEYNPFHNGHLHHLKVAKELTSSDFVIAIMSGNFVQRGEPSCIDKFSRTKIALEAGIDLVIELPTLFASASAEFFSFGAIKILSSLNSVDCICFGAETDDIQAMSNVADILLNQPEDFTRALKQNLELGMSFPRARSLALKEYSNILEQPNNILGIEYIKALKRLNSSIVPYAIQRKSVDHNSEYILDNITSATNIRKLLKSGQLEILKKVMPDYVYNIISSLYPKNKICELNDFSHMLQYKLKSTNKNELKTIFGMIEGLENRLTSCASNYFNINEILDKLKTKRYTHTNLQRLLIHTILDIKTSDINNVIHGNDLYARVLGFKKESTELLRVITNNSSIPIITNINDFSKENNNEILRKELMWTDIYNLTLGISTQNIELKEKMIVH